VKNEWVVRFLETAYWHAGLRLTERSDIDGPPDPPPPPQCWGLDSVYRTLVPPWRNYFHPPPDDHDRATTWDQGRRASKLARGTEAITWTARRKRIDRTTWQKGERGEKGDAGQKSSAGKFILPTIARSRFCLRNDQRRSLICANFSSRTTKRWLAAFAKTQSDSGVLVPQGVRPTTSRSGNEKSSVAAGRRVK
jgi:hypothetical protein